MRQMIQPTGQMPNLNDHPIIDPDRCGCVSLVKVEKLFILKIRLTFKSVEGSFKMSSMRI